MKPFAALLVASIAIAATAQQPSSELVSVRIVVRPQVANAYVALVPPDRPSWCPLAEAIAPRGSTTLQAPRGLYQVFVGSLGFQDAWRTVQIKSGTTLTFDLLPSAPTKGVLLDTTGKPLPGATVTNLRASGPVELGQASPMARRYFASEWATRTDTEGKWTLPGRDDASIPVLFEAAGYAPASEIRRARESSPKPATLAAGSSLTVTLDRADADIFLTLHRDKEVNDADPITLMQAASSTTIAWPSLKPGNYTVVAQYLDPRRFADLHALGNVTLNPGQRGELHAALPVPIPAAVDFAELFLPGRPTDELEALHAFVTTRYGPEAARAAFQRTSGGTLVYVKTPAAAKDIHLITNDAIYVAGRRSATEPDGPFETVKSPRADLTVRLTTAAGDPLPRYARVQFGACTAAAPNFAFITPLSLDGNAQIPYPTACRSMLLHVPPFEPVAIQASLQTHEKRTVGPYALKPGGSADVQVRRDPGGASAGGAIVRALFSESGPDRLLVTEATAGDSGRVVLAGLPTDREIIIEAEEAGPGLSASVRTRLLAGQATHVEVAIPRPGTVSVTPKLSREFIAHFPQARIHSVTLDRDRDADHHLRRNADLSAVDHALFENLRPGLWHVIVLLEAAGTIQPLPAADVDVRPGVLQELTPDVEPAVFDGRVVSAGAGITAQIGFGDPPSSRSVTRFARSDAQGRFTALLPARGIYRITITPISRPDMQVSLGEINFNDPSQSVELIVPTGAAVVTVMERGDPVSNATVTATLRRTTAYGTMSEAYQEAKTDSHGQARLSGLLDGRWLIEAEVPASGSRAEAALLIASRTTESAAIELNLQPPSSLKGTIQRASNSVVPSAAVDCLFIGPSGVPQTAHAESDAEGHFAIDLPSPPPPTLHCGVTTLAGEIAAFTLGPTNSADFLLPSETGSLLIPDFGPHATRERYWLVARDGRLFSLGWAQAKLSSYWSALALPRVQAGEWKIVNATTAEDWMRLATAGGNALQPVVELRLQAGKSITAHLENATDGHPNETEVPRP